MDRKLRGGGAGWGAANPEVYQVGSPVRCPTGEKTPCPYMCSLEGLGSCPRV